MKNIDKQVKEIHFFYLIRKGEAAYDFEFAKILPPVIKKSITNTESIDSKVLKANFEKLFDYTEFIINNKFAKKHNTDKKIKQFILYRMYNEIDTFEEMEDIKINLLKEISINK